MRDWKSCLRERLSLPAMIGHRDERAIAELADHLEDLYQEALSRGASEEEAEAEIERYLDAAAGATDDLIRGEPAHRRAQINRWAEGREERLRHKGRGWTAVADVARDLRLGLRALARRPLFSAVVVLVLALGIGATTAIFTLLDAIILSPLPFADADRLVSVRHTAPGLGVQDAGQCAAWHLTYEDENRTFEDIGMYGPGSSTITGQGEPESVPDLGVTSGVFRALRVQPVLGRLFTPEDEQLEAPWVVLLGYGYWQSRFGGDPDVLGQTIQADGLTLEIVGVAPASIRTLGTDPAIIYPFRFDRSTLFVGNIGLGGVARLREGVTVQQANADAARILPLAFEKFPGGPVADFSERARFAPNIEPLKNRLVGHVADLLWVLMAGVAVVLLIACANVANLFLVRADGKEAEMAVRAAMGANRARIAWEYLKESLLLGVVGGIGGLGLAYYGLDAAVAGGAANLPRLDEVSVNESVLLFTLLISLAAGAFFGTFPVFRFGRSGLVDGLKEGGRSGTTGKRRHRVLNSLAASQVALALVLLVASGLVLRSFLTLSSVDPGFKNPNDVLTLRLYIPPGEIEGAAEAAATHERIARRLAEIPGVESVALASSIPMGPGGNVNPLYVEGVEYTGDQTAAIRRHKWIGEGYLETLQIPLLLGRTLTWQDVYDRSPAVLVSESLAREYWGSPEAAMGQRLAVRPDPPRWYEVVGVVKDVLEDGLGQRPPLMVYWPQVTLAFWEGTTLEDVQTWRSMSYAIRSPRVGTPGLLGEVRNAVWEINPNLPVRGLSSLRELMAQSITETSFTLALLGIAAGVALLLGLVGVYGVISYAVSQRARELGLRMALGAEAGQVKRMVVRQGLVLAGIGVVVGLALSFGVTRLMAGLLFGVSPMDPTTFACVAAGLTGVAVVASYLPARRASRVDPMNALRAE